MLIKTCYISSSTRVHLTNNSAYEQIWPCYNIVTFTCLISPTLLRNLAGAICDIPGSTFTMDQRGVDERPGDSIYY